MTAIRQQQSARPHAGLSYRRLVRKLEWTVMEYLQLLALDPPADILEAERRRCREIFDELMYRDPRDFRLREWGTKVLEFFPCLQKSRPERLVVGS